MFENQREQEAFERLVKMARGDAELALEAMRAWRAIKLLADRDQPGYRVTAGESAICLVLGALDVPQTIFDQILGEGKFAPPQPAASAAAVVSAPNPQLPENHAAAGEPPAAVTPGDPDADLDEEPLAVGPGARVYVDGKQGTGNGSVLEASDGELVVQMDSGQTITISEQDAYPVESERLEQPAGGG